MPQYGRTDQRYRSSYGTIGREDRSTASQHLLLLLGRLALGTIFVQSGFGKLINPGGFTASLEAMGLPMASILAVAGAGVEFFGGLAIVLGLFTPMAALLVGGFVLIATFLAHRYWDMPPNQQGMQQIQFMKNMAIFGGLLTLAAAGAGRLSFDGLRTGRGRD